MGNSMLPDLDDASQAYLDLLARAVSNYLYLGGSDTEYVYPDRLTHRTIEGVWLLPECARPHTGLRLINLNHLHNLVRDLLARNIPGDFLEAGVWQGGVIIFLAGILRAYGNTNVRVWAADTFRGIPVYAQTDCDDVVDRWVDRWEVSLATVKETLRRYGLLNDRIQFVQGAFRDAIPGAGIESVALLRVDADSYVSTLDALDHLYSKVSVGGVVIIDDWHLPGCRRAVLNFRKAHQITSPIEGVFVKDDPEPYEVFWRVA